MEDYGPFATVIAIAAALIATFSLMLVKAVGRLNQWTGLIPDTRPFVVRYGAQALAVALIGLTFITINEKNYLIFAGLAVAFGLGMIVSIAFFERLRRVHVLRVPVTGKEGAQARDEKGKPIYTNLLIGTESEMLPRAVEAYKKACKNHPMLSPEDFLSGAGTPYNASSLWGREYLAGVSNRLTMSLLGIVLCGIMALYLAASSVEVTTRTPSAEEQPSTPATK